MIDFAASSIITSLDLVLQPKHWNRRAIHDNIQRQTVSRILLPLLPVWRSGISEHVVASRWSAFLWCVRLYFTKSHLRAAPATWTVEPQLMLFNILSSYTHFYRNSFTFCHLDFHVAQHFSPIPPKKSIIVFCYCFHGVLVILEHKW